MSKVKNRISERVLRSDANPPKLYQYNLLSKVMPSDRRAWGSFKVYAYDDEVAQYIAEEIEDPYVGEDSALANRAKLAVKSVLRFPNELDYELPAGYSPVNMKWVGVRLQVFSRDEHGQITGEIGSQFITIPGVDDVAVLRDALQEIEDASYIWLPCNDGVWRAVDRIRVEKIDEYRV